MTKQNTFTSVPASVACQASSSSPEPAGTIPYALHYDTLIIFGHEQLWILWQSAVVPLCHSATQICRKVPL